MLLLVLQGIYFYVCIKFDIQAASGDLLYMLSRLLFVCVHFDIQTTSGALLAVTSVVFFDGPKGVFVDYTPVLLDGDISRLADSGLRSNGLRIVDTGLP